MTTPSTDRRPRLWALLLALLLLPAAALHAHTQSPTSGTYRVVNGESFKITSLEVPGFTCTARVEVASSDESLATVVAPAVYDVPYTEPHTFTILADDRNTGEVTITTTFTGIDRYNDDATGPCWGMGSYTITLKVEQDICAAGATRASGRRVASRTAWDGDGNQWDLVIENGVISGRAASAYSANCIYDVTGSYDASGFTMSASYVGGDTNRDLCCANSSPAVISGTMSYGDLLLVGDGHKVGYNAGACGTSHYVLFGCNEPPPSTVTLCDNRSNRWQLAAENGTINGYATAFNSANCIYGITGSFGAGSFNLSSTYVGGSTNRDLCCANASTGTISGSLTSSPLSASGTYIGYNAGSCGSTDYRFGSCDGSPARDYTIVLQDDTGNQWNLNAEGGSISGFVNSYHSASCIYEVSGTFDASGFTLSTTFAGDDQGAYYCCANASTGVITGTLGGGTISASGTRIGYNTGECGSWDYTYTPRR